MVPHLDVTSNFFGVTDPKTKQASMDCPNPSTLQLVVRVKLAVECFLGSLFRMENATFAAPTAPQFMSERSHRWKKIPRHGRWRVETDRVNLKMAKSLNGTNFLKPSPSLMFLRQISLVDVPTFMNVTSLRPEDFPPIGFSRDYISQTEYLYSGVRLCPFPSGFPSQCLGRLIA